MNVAVVMPEWPAPDGVRALVTTRAFGNLSRKQAADLARADDNRRLVTELGLPGEPVWLNQVHGVDVVSATRDSPPEDADAAITQEAHLPLVVMVADCLPVLLATSSGEKIGVVHAGWRGLAAGIIGRAVNRLDADGGVIAWLGPAIGPCHYEVDEQVRSRFPADVGFTSGRDDRHWMMDLCAIARDQLGRAGVDSVFGGDFCTYCDDRFYSYRRNATADRFAAIIWKEQE